MSARVRVMAAVIVRDGALLLGARPAGKRHGGLWECPGGKVEASEDDDAALRRELREELGVAVERVGAVLFERGDPGSPYWIVFRHVEIHGEPRAIEHAALGFFAPERAAALALAPSDAAFVAALRDGTVDLPP